MTKAKVVNLLKGRKVRSVKKGLYTEIYINDNLFIKDKYNTSAWRNAYNKLTGRGRFKINMEIKSCMKCLKPYRVSDFNKSSQAKKTGLKSICIHCEELSQ